MVVVPYMFGRSLPGRCGVGLGTFVEADTGLFQDPRREQGVPVLVADVPVLGHPVAYLLDPAFALGLAPTVGHREEVVRPDALVTRPTVAVGDEGESGDFGADLVDQFVRPGQLSCVPTYHVNNSRSKTTVVLALASMLVDEKLSNNPNFQRIKDTPLVVGMDEAHNFLTGADNVQARQVIGKFTEAAKQGRKERLGLFLITQDPQDIADPVFKQINSTVVLNLGDEDAISAVNIPTNLESKVPYMEKGQMVVYSPDNSEPVEIQGLSSCLTRHGRD